MVEAGRQLSHLESVAIRAGLNGQERLLQLLIPSADGETAYSHRSSAH